MHNPKDLYVNYLSTTAIVTAVEELDRKLSTPNGVLLTKQRQVLQGVRRDLLKELGRRQLTLL